jgi:hypothetical protein
MQLYETFTDLSTHFRNFYAALKHVPFDATKGYELDANEERNCSEPLLEFL